MNEADFWIGDRLQRFTDDNSEQRATRIHDLTSDERINHQTTGIVKDTMSNLSTFLLNHQRILTSCSKLREFVTTLFSPCMLTKAFLLKDQ